MHNFVQSLKASQRAYAADLQKKEKRIAPTWIMNLSMYGPIDDDLSEFYMADPYSRLLYVAAAGNGPEPHSLLSQSIYTHYDDGDSNVLIVGALDREHQIAGYSNQDRKYVDIFAQDLAFAATVGNSTEILLISKTRSTGRARPPPL